MSVKKNGKSFSPNDDATVGSNNNYADESEYDSIDFQELRRQDKVNSKRYKAAKLDRANKNRELRSELRDAVDGVIDTILDPNNPGSTSVDTPSVSSEPGMDLDIETDLGTVVFSSGYSAHDDIIENVGTDSLSYTHDLALIQGLALNVNAGYVRSVVDITVEAFKQNFSETDPFLSLPFGSDVFVFNKLGRLLEPLPSKTTLVDSGVAQLYNAAVATAANHVGWQFNIVGSLPQGHCGVSKIVRPSTVGGANNTIDSTDALDVLAIPVGLLVVVGGGGIGKSPLLVALAKSNSDEFAFVRYGEPLAGYLVSPTDGATALAHSLLYYRDIVFDSAKNILSTAAGAAIKAGLSRGAFVFFSHLSTIASNRGSTIYTAANPSVDDPGAISSLTEAVNSNATCVVLSLGNDTWALKRRTGESLPRVTTIFKTMFDDNGELSIVFISSQTSASDKPLVTDRDIIDSITDIDEVVIPNFIDKDGVGALANLLR